MLRSIDSTPDTHHVRRLLDQRVGNRLDPDDNFCGLTQYTDTPSVYAPTYFSPSLRPQHDGSYSPRDRLNDPNMSSLDMDDEPRFSLAISQSDTTTNEDNDDTHSFEDDDDAGQRPGEDADGRLSYLGPKMRFHSRAPWEMEGDIPEEEEDFANSPKHHGFPFSFGGSGKGNHSTGSSSPRPSFGRPSADSSRSHLMPKRSFDTINSQMSSKGALYALAQESLSSASLARTNPPPQKDSLFGKLSSIGRARGNSSPPSPVLLPTRSRANSRAPPIHHNPLDSVSQADYDPFAANQSHYMGHVSRPQSPIVTSEVIHPYANPDALPDRNSSYSTSLQLHAPSRNDSTTTVTQKFDLGSSAAPRNSVTSSIATGKHRVSSIHGREISSPVAIQGTSLPPEMSGFDQAGGMGHLPGWKEKFVPPAFNLISLEEARALRAKPQPQPPADDSTPMQSVADLLSHPTSMQASAEGSLSTIHHEPSPNGRTRGRTISTGTKAKTAFQSMVGSVATESRRESEPSITPTRPAPVSQMSSKPLKHKKSGFMRLFNGGKDKETDEIPPPLPSPSNTSDVASLSAKRVVSRVPVPSYSQPPPGSASPQDSTFSIQSNTNQPSPTKRGPPTLSIDTVSSNSQSRAMPDQRYQQRTTSSLYAPKPWSGGDQPPASAPPDMTGFPALKLRPVSSLFSSGFEHIVPDLALSSDFDTPTSFSPNGPLSPITPGKMDRFSKSDTAAPSANTSSQLASSQRRVAELEDQVRSLKAELEALRSRQHDHIGPYCSSCGRGNISSAPRNGSMSSHSSSSSSGGSVGIGYTSVINRPRAKTSTTSRFVNALA